MEAQWARRKPLRLRDYDYSRSGMYFVTICTKDRVCCLSRVEAPGSVGALHEAPVITLTDLGRIVDKMIVSLPKRYPGVQIEKYVVMPNHIHLLLRLPAPETGAHRDAPLPAGKTEKGGTRALLAQIVGYLKMNASKETHAKYPGLQLWQSRFHDHVVRNEADCLRIWNYIDANPAKWAEDKYYVP